MKRFFALFAIMIIVYSLLLVIPFNSPFAIKNEQISCDNYEHINTEQIEIKPDRIVINIPNVSISKYANTSSMLPLINENSKGIAVKPKSEEEIKTGDVITYEEEGLLIIHRVIETGGDENGWYVIVKGDNAAQSDGKVRFSQIKSILIGVLY